MLRLGLTGGIGSGKSTVAALLESMGAQVVDADAISRAATGQGGAAITLIEQQFGADFIDASGALNRDRMRELVFADPDAKRRLERIIHPLVGEAIAARTQSARDAGTRCLVYDIPLLVESAHWRTHLDRVLVVDCSEDVQRTRVMARNGLSAPEVDKIIAVQASRQRRLSCADAVIFNNSSALDALAEQVRQCAAHFGL